MAAPTPIHQASEMVGFIPEELRTDFSKELPLRDFDKQHSAYTSIWRYGEVFDSSKLHPDIQHYLPIIELVIRLGRLSITNPEDCLVVAVRQVQPEALSPSYGLHCDGYPGTYRRAIVGDTLGTLNERAEATPDYGILVIGATTPHAAQRSFSRKKKTRLQLSLHSLIDGVLPTSQPMTLNP